MFPELYRKIFISIVSNILVRLTVSELAQATHRKLSMRYLDLKKKLQKILATSA